jgi:hypothetical protein
VDEEVQHDCKFCVEFRSLDGGRNFAPLV